MDEELNDNGENRQVHDAGSDAERTSIRSAGLRDSEERSNWSDFRREIRRRESWTSLWTRIVSVLKIKRGVFSEIASDGGATWQAVLVFAVASTVSSLRSGSSIPLGVAWSFSYVLVDAGVYFLVCRLLAYGVAPLAGWARALLFTNLPIALGVVPTAGLLVGMTYSLVLEVVAIRELAGITTGRAVGVLVIQVIFGGIPFVILPIVLSKYGIILGPMQESLDSW